MSHEKSQLENMALPPQGGETAQAQKKSPALSPGFSLGQQLTVKGKPTPRSETLKYSMPNYLAGVDRASQEEKEKKAWMEKEGINYDLYLLIEEKLVPEFQEKLNKGISEYDDLKKTNLLELIEENPDLYTLNPKDVQFITNNLKEFFSNIRKNHYPHLGIFLNSFIHAYFNFIPEEERENLKLFLANTDKLSFIGAELSFGELEVEEVGIFFGYQAHGSVTLEAKKVRDWAGYEAYENAHILVEKAIDNFGRKAHGSAILEAEEVRNYAGQAAYENAHVIVKEAEFGFGYQAHGSAILEAEKVGNNAGARAYENAYLILKEAGEFVGYRMDGDATITITEKYGSIGKNRKGKSKVILPDGRVLMPGDSV